MAHLVGRRAIVSADPRGVLLKPAFGEHSAAPAVPVLTAEGECCGAVRSGLYAWSGASADERWRSTILSSANTIVLPHTKDVCQYCIDHTHVAVVTAQGCSPRSTIQHLVEDVISRVSDDGHGLRRNLGTKCRRTADSLVTRTFYMLLHAIESD